MKIPHFTMLMMVAFYGVVGCGSSSSRQRLVPGDDFLDAAGAPAFEQDIRVFVGPLSGGGELLDSVRGARHSIHVAMFLLTSQDVIDALVAQSRAGLDVRVILNQSFPRGGNPNQRAYRHLTNAGAKVAWGPAEYRFMHAKYVIVDSALVWILTMNAVDKSISDNREYLVLDTIPTHVIEAERVFRSDFVGENATLGGHLLVAPVNAETLLIELINSATTELLLQAPALAEAHIERVLLQAADRGVSIRIVLPLAGAHDASRQAAWLLKNHGALVSRMEHPHLHAKAIVVDRARAYTGSVNFTKTSLHRNREIGVITDVQSEVEKVAQMIDQDFDRGQKL